MTTIELSPGCQRWVPGSPTKHPPLDKIFLETVIEAGFLAFTHHGGLCGGQSEHRAVLIIHRGRGTRWEVVFQESDLDVVTTTTTDLGNMTTTMLAWLRGRSLSAKENSVRAEAG
jgi:hypothetical protein